MYITRALARTFYTRQTFSFDLAKMSQSDVLSQLRYTPAWLLANKVIQLYELMLYKGDQQVGRGSSQNNVVYDGREDRGRLKYVQ